jgi:hypothetical protein
MVPSASMYVNVCTVCMYVKMLYHCMYVMYDVCMYDCMYVCMYDVCMTLYVCMLCVCVFDTHFLPLLMISNASNARIHSEPAPQV